MPVAEILSSIPVTELLKLVISKAKKVKDFKPLFKELVSTMERLVPIVQEIHMLQERLDPGNKELNFLTELLVSAKKMVDKCTQVRVYDAVKKISYAEKIKGINENLLKFCQLDLSLIQHRNMLRSLSLKMEESSLPRLEHNSNVSSRDDDEQQIILANFKDKGKGKKFHHDQEYEQVAVAIQESLNMQHLPQKTIVSRCKQEQQVILASIKDKGKGKQVHHDQEDEQVTAAIQESLHMQHLPQKTIVSRRKQEHQVILASFKDKGKGKQVHHDQEDEQVAAAIQESLNMQHLPQKTIVSHRRRKQEEQVIMASFKDKGKGKQVHHDQEDEQVAAAIQESLNMQHLPQKTIVSRHKQEHQVILASFKDKGKGKQVHHDQEDEQVAAAIQESLNMQHLPQKTIVSRRKQEQQVILASFKDKGKGKQVHHDQEDEQVATAIQESLNMQHLPQKTIVSCRKQEQQVILASVKDKGKGKQVHHDQEDEQVAAAIQESLNMEDLGQKTIVSHRRRQQKQQVILESCKDKGKAKKLHEEEYGQVAAAIEESLNMEELSVRQAIQESIDFDMKQVATKRAKEIEKNKQIAIALQYDENERITNGSSSSISALLDEKDVQRILWESVKNKGKGKQLD